MTLQVTNMTQGQQATLSITSTSRASSTVTVTLESPTGDTMDVDVAIGPNGKGSAAFTVPAWDSATIKDGVCDEIVRGIELPPIEQPGE